MGCSPSANPCKLLKNREKSSVEMKFKCFRCGKLVEWEDNPFRPFCSERCKLADLDDWLEERYTIQGEEPPPKEQEVEKDEKNN